jgi:hypothetical protein
VAFDVALWREALRVAKPGAHLLAFGATRMYHRLAVAIEDAGWEIRDCLVWAYAEGFPGGQDIARAIDKELGAAPLQLDREWLGSPHGKGRAKRLHRITAPGSPTAQKWRGWNTRLRPSWEPIVMARKPVDGSIVHNVLAHGVGGVNIGETKVAGRWTPNVLLTDPVLGDRSRLFLVPKAKGARRAGAEWHDTVKPLELMLQLVRLVTPRYVPVLYCANCEPDVSPVPPDVHPPPPSAVLLPRMQGSGEPEAPYHVRTVQRGVLGEGPIGGSEVLLPEVRGSSADAAAEGLRDVRGIVPAAGVGGEDVLSVVSGTSGGGTPEEAVHQEREGLHPPVATGPSDGDADGVRGGAPARDGGDAGPDAAADGGRGPHQRGEGRQPSRESASDDEAGPRRVAQAAAEGSGVPPLSRHPRTVGACPKCGGHLAPGWRRGRVLDPFCGSGSTGVASVMLGMDVTLIELTGDYAVRARQRLDLTEPL